MFRVEQRGAVAVLEMACGKANAMDTEFCRGLTEQLEKLRASDARAVVITGTGNIFSAGVDLPRLISGGPEYLPGFLAALNGLFEAAMLFPKPLVAAINGHAIAGGCILACCADRRVMARGTGRVGVPELLVGVPFPAVALELLRQTVAPQYLQEIIYSAATFTDEEALRRGLVDELVEPAELLDRAVAHAARMAALPHEAFAMSKQQFRSSLVERVRQSAANEAAMKQYWTSPKALDAIRAYVDRTLKKKS